MLREPGNAEIKRLFEWVSSAAKDKQAHRQWQTRGASSYRLYRT